MVTVLSLYITKDSVNKRCYESVLTQIGVEQDLVVVSAKRVNGLNNFVVEVSEDDPLPVRVGSSINKALAKFWDHGKYDYFFKVDGDVFVPPNFICEMIAMKEEIVGPGCAILIEAGFFEKHFKSRWAVCYCDDMYMKAYAFSKGMIETVWEEKSMIEADYDYPNVRRYLYGKEYYKFGAPLWYVILILLVSIINSIRKMKHRVSAIGSLNLLGGYLSAVGTKRYRWKKDFARRITQLYFRKVLRALNILKAD